MGDAPLGLITSGTYSAAAKRPANEAFLAAWKREYGDKSMPDFLLGRRAGTAWRRSLTWSRRPRASSPPTRRWRSCPTGRTRTARAGRSRSIRETRDIIQNIYIRRVEKAGRQARQCRDRDDPNGQGSVEGAEPAEVIAVWRDPVSAWAKIVLSAAVSIAFHGLAFAMVLYLISVGLSVTMGLMGFVNLAHGVFAMAGGYVVTSLMSRWACRFVPALLAAAVAVALASIPVERLLYRRLLRRRRARPGAADNGARLHVGRGRHLYLGPAAAALAAAAMAERRRSISVFAASPPIAAS